MQPVLNRIKILLTLEEAFKTVLTSISYLLKPNFFKPLSGLKYLATMRYKMLLFLLAGCCHAFSQNLVEIEKLKNKLSVASSGKEKIDLLNAISKIYSSADSANTFLYADKAALLAEQNNYPYGIAQSLVNKGSVMVNKMRPKESFAYFTRAQELFSPQKNQLELAYLHTFWGKAYSLAEQPAVAISYFEKALPYFLSTKNNDGQLAVYNNLGVLYNTLGERDKSIEYYLKALKISEENNLPNVQMLSNNLGKLFYDTDNLAEARKYLLLCIEQSKKASDKLTLGKAYINYGNLFVKEDNNARAIETWQQARKSFEEINFQRGIQVCNNNIGALYLRQKKYKEALVFLNQSLAMSEEFKSISGLALVQQNIGYAHTYLNNFPEALQWFTKAEATAEKGADIYTRGEIYNHRAMLDSAMGNYASAYRYQQQYLRINEKLAGEKVTKQVNELQTKYETAKKENQINILNKDNFIKSLEIENQQLELTKNLYELSENKLALAGANLEIVNNELDIKTKNEIILQQRLEAGEKKRNIDSLKKQSEIQVLSLRNQRAEVARRNIIIGGILFTMLALSLLAFSYYKRYKLKQESLHKTQLLQEQELATRAILSAEENERKRIAAELHDGIGQMMSVAKMNLSVFENELIFTDEKQKLAFENVINMVDESCRELRSVSHQMMPNALLKNGLANAVREFIDKIDSRIIKVSLHAEGLRDKMDNDTESVLYRVIQECVNNVLKHSEANHLDISLIKDSDGIAATIEDNGKGFDSSKSRHSEGIGFKNILSRINYLKGTVDINSRPGEGTLVAIHVPVS